MAGQTVSPVLPHDVVQVRRTSLGGPLLARLRQPVSDRALMGALVGLAACLRVPNLTRAYWVDEGITIGIASHRLTQIPGLLRRDGSPPLFYLVLHFWLRLFGTSEVSTHLLPLLLSLLVLPVAWWCTATLFGSTAARYAALLAATNPFLNWYSTETRMYPLICGLSLVGVTMAVRATRRRQARDALWATICFVALVYTHNWGLYVVVVTAAVLGLVAVRNCDWRQALTVAGCTGVVAIGYLPWLASFLFQAGHTAAPWAVRPSLGDLISDPASTLAGTLGVIVVPLLVIGLLYTWMWRNAEDNVSVDLIGSVALLTLAAGWVVAQIEPSWTSRYLAVALGPLFVAISGTLSSNRLGRRIMGGSAVILVMWSVIGSLLPDPNSRYSKSNAAAVAGAARPFIHPGDLVIVTQTEQLAVLAHYLPAGLHYATPTGAVSDTRVVDWRDLVARLARADDCQTIAPQIDALPVGARILVINPLKRVGASGTRWSLAVTAQVDSINQLLFDDPGLTEIASFAPATSPKPFSAVTGLLFAKRSGPPTCS